MDNLILQITKAKQNLSLIYFRILSFTELPAWQCDLVLFRDWPATFLRWLDWIFLGRYLPSLSLNYVGMSKDIEKRLPQLYYIKMKIFYDLGFIAIGVAMAT